MSRRKNKRYSAAEAERKRLRIVETPIKQSRPRYARTKKLRTVRDGLRHLWNIVKTPE